MPLGQVYFVALQVEPLQATSYLEVHFVAENVQRSDVHLLEVHAVVVESHVLVAVVDWPHFAVVLYLHSLDEGQVNALALQVCGLPVHITVVFTEQ